MPKSEVKRVLMDLEIAGDCPIDFFEELLDIEIPCNRPCDTCGLQIIPEFKKGDILIFYDDNSAGVVRNPDKQTAAKCQALSRLHSSI
jgi:hypothetical protein